MPIYEYQCQQCGHHHEALQKISDPQLRQCPECGRRSLKRLVSAVRFRLAGSGWYETDFKSEKEAKRNLHEKGDREEAKKDGDGAEAPKTDAKDTAKTDTKSEPTTSAASKDGASEASTRASRPAAAPVRPKTNGRKKPASRAPAARQRRR